MNSNDNSDVKQKMVVKPHTWIAWLKVAVGSFIGGIGSLFGSERLGKLALRLARSARKDCTIELK